MTVTVTRRVGIDPDAIKSVPPGPGKQVVNIFVTSDGKIQFDYEES